MSESGHIKVALVGNPNCGKTTLFNRLTGLNQKVGNFPGVTVDKHSGKVHLPNGQTMLLIDLPGAYSLSAASQDEQVVQEVLLNPSNPDHPELILLVVDATALQRNLFFASQIADLGIPMILAVNMMDVLNLEKRGIDLKLLQSLTEIPVVGISAKKGYGIKDLLEQVVLGGTVRSTLAGDVMAWGGEALKALLSKSCDIPAYRAFKSLNNPALVNDPILRNEIEAIRIKHNYNAWQAELTEINARYAKAHAISRQVVNNHGLMQQKLRSAKIDKIATHPFWGLLMFLSVFFVLFQTVFFMAQFPMNWIDSGMAWLGTQVANSGGAGFFFDLLSDGIIPGLSGVLVFLPQIMILFGLITILEDTGYLSRVSFMSDGILKRFGMNGKSVVPLVGGFACAVPSIMATRTIKNPKDRLITIFIIPLMSCSARLPIYVFLISFIVPEAYVWGVLSLQGLFMLGLYLSGVIFALIVAVLLNRFIKTPSSSSFILELPDYKSPAIKNVWATMIAKGKTFVLEAGKVIFIASVLLWLLSYFGPRNARDDIRDKYATEITSHPEMEDTLIRARDAELLEYSFLGYMGRSIEPAIEPLGYDWKIGIALINSFAAREIFVGTMATIYSVENSMSDKRGLRAIHFSFPVALSLLVFYVFAMQCFSTMTVVRNETGSWKWPIIQWFVFTGMAYLFALIAYQIAS